jgi:heme/copper-type cytochrome/quinol oxidase subunit 2
MLHALLADSPWLPKQASTVAGPSDGLFNVILWICVFFFLLVTVLLLVLVVKYRHREGVKTDTSAAHSMTLEITWTLVPSILVVFLYYYGFKQYMNMAIEPPNSYPITVRGQMWQWSFIYPNGHEEPELHCVVNQPVRCALESNDVIHSLSVPDFRIKKDVVPGRYNRIWFQPTSADGGIYITQVTLNGHPEELAVDLTGRALSDDEKTTPSRQMVKAGELSDPVKAALAALAPQSGGKPTTLPADRKLEAFTLLNGETFFLAPAGLGAPQSEVFIDLAGKPWTQVVQFGAAPAAVQSGLKALAHNIDIPAGQVVHVFPDAEAFDIFCAQYCGTNHSTMHSRVIVHSSQADFDAWLVRASDDKHLPAPKRGERLYVTKGCAGCHSVNGSPSTGPTWKDLFGSTQNFDDGSHPVVDDEFVHSFVRNPIARGPVGFAKVMTPFPPDVLKPEDIDLIVAYMKSISKNYHETSPQPGSGVATQPSTHPATAPAGKVAL